MFENGFRLCERFWGSERIYRFLEHYVSADDNRVRCWVPQFIPLCGTVIAYEHKFLRRRVVLGPLRSGVGVSEAAEGAEVGEVWG